MGYLSPPPSPLPVVVQKDVGGLVSDYENRTEAYRRENREVRLHECRSACTLALSLPNVCVYPDAKLKFHQAYNEQTREADLGVSQKLFDSYPAAVRARLGVLTRQYKVLSGSELIALGVRGCGGENRVIIATRKSAPPPVPANPLSEIARNVRMAVANALARPESAPPAPIVIAIPDRDSAPPALARLAGDAKARAAKTRLADLARARGEPASSSGAPAPSIPLPPHRPDFGSSRPDAPATPIPTAVSTLIPGARPILDATRFLPGEPSREAEAQRENAGG